MFLKLFKLKKFEISNFFFFAFFILRQKPDVVKIRKLLLDLRVRDKLGLGPVLFLGLVLILVILLRIDSKIQC